MNWDDAKVFLAVAREGQILSASRRLQLNHATVARRLDALEGSLGTRLFVRKTTGCVLTAEGEAFLVHAEVIESRVLQAQQVRGSDAPIEGVVRVGAPDGFGVSFLAPRLGELTERNPGLRIELVPVPRTFSLSRREADIAVTLERPREGRLVASKLTDYRLGLYASPQYIAKAGTPKTLADLRRHCLVGYVDDLLFSTSLDYTAEYLKDWKSTLAISSATGQTAAVRAGAGIGILHGFIARNDPALVPVLQKNTLQRTYWTVIHDDLRQNQRVSLVSRFLREIVERERPVFD